MSRLEITFFPYAKQIGHVCTGLVNVTKFTRIVNAHIQTHTYLTALCGISPVHALQELGKGTRLLLQ